MIVAIILGFAGLSMIQQSFTDGTNVPDNMRPWGVVIGLVLIVLGLVHYWRVEDDL
jgi:divalent metal cation (Fe/Co/Zn/Cd) transporter